MTGLVLEGGAMRGLFTAGVIDVMMERGVEFDGIVGVSAGAAFGCNYKSRQIGRVIRYNKLMAHNWRFCSFRSWLATGDLIGAKFAYETLPNEIDIFDRATYNANPTNFYAVCTDVITGEPVYQEVNTITDATMNWIRASASMPLFSRIVDIDGQKLLDGGVADSIPLEWMERRGYDRNVVVLTQPQGYVKKPMSLMPVMSLAYRKYPRFVEAMRRRHEMYNAELAYVSRAEQEGRAIVIRPPYPLPIGHISHDPARMQQIYALGRQTALAAPHLHF
ncbi:MAG: patatin family protein [Muribaculaceae bacterium]|nr:patatin family protein [Muribaculaceae bacterium]